MLSISQVLDIFLRLGRDVVLDQMALAVRMLKELHLELVHLHCEVRYATRQIAVDSFHVFFVGAQPQCVLSFLHTEFIGGNSVSFLNLFVMRIV